MLTWEDVLKVLAMFGGVGAIAVAAVRFGAGVVAQRLAEGHRRQTEVALTELRGRVDEALSRLNAGLQHRNFVLQRLAEIELNGIHSCWRAAAHVHFLVNGLRPLDCGTDTDALETRLQGLSKAHNTLLALLGKYDPFLDQTIRAVLGEITRIARLEMSQAAREPFMSRWWDQGDSNRAALETLIAGLRAGVQLRIAALRLVSEDRTLQPEV